MRSALALILAAGIAAFAQDAPPPGVRITFLPPPLEGTLSAGIYTVDGKLVRVLAREATDNDFTAGLNGFITQWDGKDDTGNVAANGRYFVRGFAVGELAIEGVAFHGNDWLENDGDPRITDVQDIQLAGDDLLVRALGTDGKEPVKAKVSLRDGAVHFLAKDAPDDPADAGAANWSIEAGSVVQRSADGSEVLRRLDYEPSEPQPQKLLARADSKEIAILERGTDVTRVRILTLQQPAKEGSDVSEWGIVFSAAIRRAPTPTPAQIAPIVGRKEPVTIDDTVRVALMQNELLQVAPAALQISVGIDDRGSFLRTSDGLPLRRVTDTPNLKWAVLSRNADGSVTLFQSDGAAIEEYRVTKLNQMMAFDAGEYDWTAPK